MNKALAQGVTVAGRFQLVRCLGEGGMGEVWSARHLITKKMVALKFMKSGTEIAKKRFLREAMAVSAVKHRSVVEVHDVVEHASMPVLVMDLFEGESLDARLARVGRLTYEEAADILLPVVSAVGTAHEAGIIHRDLKPANIFLVTRGETVVLDFGIAKIVHDESDEMPTALSRGGTPGTPEYMAPEQLFGEEVDYGVDVWAIGVVLYECLSGQRPARGQNMGQIMKNVLSGTLVPIESLVPGLPADLSSLVKRMLSRRADRPELSEVMRVLRRYAIVDAPEFRAPRVASASSPDGGPDHVTLDAPPKLSTFERSATAPAPQTNEPVAGAAQSSETRRRSLLAVTIVAALVLGGVLARFVLFAPRSEPRAVSEESSIGHTAAAAPDDAARAAAPQAATAASAPGTPVASSAPAPVASALPLRTPPRSAPATTAPPKPAPATRPSAKPASTTPATRDNGAPILD